MGILVETGNKGLACFFGNQTAQDFIAFRTALQERRAVYVIADEGASFGKARTSPEVLIRIILPGTQTQIGSAQRAWIGCHKNSLKSFIQFFLKCENNTKRDIYNIIKNYMIR